MVVTCCELKWLRQLLSDLCVLDASPILLYIDNQAAMYITTNLVYHEQIKHIEMDCHFVHDEYQARRISLTYVPSQSQLANIFTKDHGHHLFYDLMCKLGILNLHAPTWRVVLMEDMICQD